MSFQITINVNADEVETSIRLHIYGHFYTHKHTI